MKNQSRLLFVAFSVFISFFGYYFLLDLIKSHNFKTIGLDSYDSNQTYLNTTLVPVDANTAETNQTNISFSSFSSSSPLEHPVWNQSPNDGFLNRAILLYFPTEQIHHFWPEFKWFFRSWIEMQKYESPKWRTDIIVFVSEILPQFLNLGCSCDFYDKTKKRIPMCLLVHHTPLKTRNLTQKHEEKLALFQQELKHYSYVDSILSVVEGYSRFKEYDIVMRSDMDVFLTPKFATWSFIHREDFQIGLGGYSNSWNTAKLERIATNFGLESSRVENLGSTWYSTPQNIFLVANSTLYYMYRLSVEEFSTPEKNGQIGVLLWPYWHYGVLLLYGQHLVLNHLIATRQLNVVKVNFDSPSTLDLNVMDLNSSQTPLHIHVWHSNDVFSKFKFKNGDYDNWTWTQDKNKEGNNSRYYSLHLALDSKTTKDQDMKEMYNRTVSLKI